ncbi:MAG TPA: twin-arginine translocation signal domain-containing protein [Verrucomicrobiae bacterium]
MNDKFDKLAKGLAQSVTRRGALKKFGAGLAGIALAALGLANKAEAREQPGSANAGGGPKPFHCRCYKPYYGCDPSSVSYFDCSAYCGSVC